MLTRALNRPPRHAHAWLLWFIPSQLGAIGLWWSYGWLLGLPLLFLGHLAMVWATLWPRSRWLAPVLSQLPTDARVVWLTIDDGPSNDTVAILDRLDAYRAKATFFLVGERARQRPDLVREIARRGHGIGNHSDTHPQAWFWALPPARMRREIDCAQQTLTRITGQAPPWFRAVVGMSNPFVAAPLKHHGLTRVAWRARGFDAIVSDPAQVMKQIERGLAPGAIVLLHEGAPHGRNVEILDRTLSRLGALGYRTLLPDAPDQTG